MSWIGHLKEEIASDICSREREDGRTDGKREGKKGRGQGLPSPRAERKNQHDSTV